MEGLNEYQTNFSDEEINKLPVEVKDQFLEALASIPFVRNLVSVNRKRAVDLPKDESGRVIVSLSNPHILEDMDYFRPTALNYLKYGEVTHLRPNANPNSDFGKWIREERRRCWEGYVRESDGEWVTGFMYWFLNYCPMQVIKLRNDGSNRADRVTSFPEVWEGMYWRFHYLEQAAKNGHHAAELASRARGKSYTLASILSHNFILGENSTACKDVTSIVVASQKEYLVKDGTLNKFLSLIDFCAEHTQFPRRRRKDSMQEMLWQMGYKDLDTGTDKGSMNQVLGVAISEDESKIRGKRAAKILIEEMGSFSKLLEMYNVLLPCVQSGDIVFGEVYAVGTAGDKDSDFAGAQELIYNPQGYGIHPIENVYDKPSQGRPWFCFFFPGYVNRAGCYNHDGVSDVTKALLEILMNRYRKKYQTSDPNTIVRAIAEEPITPSEAMLRTRYNLFPVTEINERIAQIDSNPAFFNDVYVGHLVFGKDNEVKFEPLEQLPIRDFPHKDNKLQGALEIFQMPEKDKKDGIVYRNRYIAGNDPYDDDGSNTMSLGSIFVLDLWTDRIVAEYTGRPQFAEDFYEICRKLCIFYNARLNYEAHPYNQEVITPSGIKQWKDICVGDTLFAPDGKTVSVVDIPMEGEDNIYELTLVDGRKVEASSNHIWKVNRLNTKTYEELTTTQLYEVGAINKFNQHNFFLPEAGAVDYPKQEVPIDPYTMGLLLAEGAFTKFRKNKVNKKTRNYVQFSSSQEDALFYKDVIPYSIKYIGTKGYSYHLYIDDVDKILDSLGLLFKDSFTKFIPAIYLYNDKETRIELLKGLMDGDGCAVNRGGSIFTSVSSQLIKDVSSLCRSLGFKVSGYYGKGKQIRISTQQSIFKLPRKKNKQYVYKTHQRGSKATALFEKTAIAKIEYVGKKPCKCVAVNSKEGLYLVGDYVVTHNCNKKGLFAYFSQKHCLHLLTDTLDYLKDKQLTRDGVGNKSKGTNATLPINNYARERLRNWLLSTEVVVEVNEDGEEEHRDIPRLYSVRNRALLKELSLWNTEGNFDRVSAMGMLMLLREDRMMLYSGDYKKGEKGYTSASYAGNDDFFTLNYDDRLRECSWRKLDIPQWHNG